MNDEYQAGYDEGWQAGYDKACEECDERYESRERHIDDLNDEIATLLAKLREISAIADDV